MQIISHRGYWKLDSEKNTYVSFERSFSLGFGTETDLRDHMGQLVVSHDMADGNCMSADELFSMYIQHNSQPLTLALNIKADGLQVPLLGLLAKYNIGNYFVFDMAIPDTLGYVKQGIKFYSRQSEYEASPALYTDCAGIWLDSFHHIWYTNEVITGHLDKKKMVAIVSPELHKREHLSLWQQLKKGHLHHAEGVILCTDFPEEAFHFFNEVQ